VELGLAQGGELDARVLNLLDGGEELVYVGDELVGAGAAEERLPRDADEHFEKLRRNLAGEEVVDGHSVVLAAALSLSYALFSSVFSIILNTFSFQLFLSSFLN